jgi:hypothetical protein
MAGREPAGHRPRPRARRGRHPRPSPPIRPHRKPPAAVTPPTAARRTETLTRLDAFTSRRPDIPVTPWHASPAGTWEAAEPGQPPRQWPSAAAMLHHLETAYPPRP